MYQKLLVVTLFFSLLTPQVFAATNAEIQAQISSLTALLQSMQSNTVSSSMTGSISFMNFSNDLSFGMKNNAEVRVLQDFLRAKGYFTGELSGNFLTVTRESVRAYQGTNGITPTGFVGPLTRTHINSRITMGSLTTPSVSSTCAGGFDSTTGQNCIKGNSSVIFPPTRAASNMSGWSTYSNNTYGIEFKYPSEFMIDEKAGGSLLLTNIQTDWALKSNFGLLDRNSKIISILNTDQQPQKTLSEICKIYKDAEKTEGTVLECKEITINGTVYAKVIQAPIKNVGSDADAIAVTLQTTQGPSFMLIAMIPNDQNQTKRLAIIDSIFRSLNLKASNSAISVAPSSSTNTSTIPSTCDNNMDCLIVAASLCQPASGTFIYNNLPSPIVPYLTESGKINYQIKPSSESCVLTVRVPAFVGSATEANRKSMQSEGATNADIENGLKKINTETAVFFNKPMTCTSEKIVITAYLKDIKKQFIGLKANLNLIGSPDSSTFVTSAGKDLVCTK